jgi:hypothetical protein
MMLTTIVAAQRPGARTRDYFPLRVGNFWKYRHNEGIEFSYKVVEAGKQADGTTLYQVQKSQTVNLNSWYTNANGWVILRKDAYPDHEGLEMTYKPPKQILKNPLNPGATWTWSGKSVTLGDSTESSTVIGSERVAVPAGKFRAMKVVSTIRDGESAKTVTNWYVDGVGLVKCWTEAGPFKYGWELIEYNIAK